MSDLRALKDHYCNLYEVLADAAGHDFDSRCRVDAVHQRVWMAAADDEAAAVRAGIREYQAMALGTECLLSHPARPDNGPESMTLGAWLDAGGDAQALRADAMHDDDGGMVTLIDAALTERARARAQAALDAVNRRLADASP